MLGVTCAAPAILAGSNDLNWGFKCVTDEWGRALYHEVTVQEMTDQDGNVLFPERIELQPVQNPVYQDKNQYIPRSKRSEWAAVCLLGMVLVRDDGTCQAGGSCRPGGGGIATASRFGYRVIRRTGAYQVLILYR
ncbi:hypothetical protein SDC9_105870 [bioreactor metagenome]|uniref:Peptidase G2 IMC autoproteolytic cleavage domain-containing protein n=1 Tax=bioreactor metagenome TaxID=1076179 RepID=A0A645B0Q9_9ZZZZ